MKEYIICSAIWYKDITLKRVFEYNVLPANCNRGIVIYGYSHAQCMYIMSSLTGFRSVKPVVGDYIQGFITNKNRFVDREEGAIIHLSNGSILGYSSKDLYSEDLYK